LPLVVSCAGQGKVDTGYGSIEQSQEGLTAEWEAYYMAVMEQVKPVELVKIELDAEGRVKSFAVNQAAPDVRIVQPKKFYSAGWETANRFVDGMWKTAQVAVPLAGGVMIAHVVSNNMADIAPSNTTNTDSYNQAGGNYAGGDYNSTVDSYNPIDNSNQNNPVSDSSDNSNYNNPIDNNSNQNNPVTELRESSE